MDCSNEINDFFDMNEVGCSKSGLFSSLSSLFESKHDTDGLNGFLNADEDDNDKLSLCICSILNNFKFLVDSFNDFSFTKLLLLLVWLLSTRAVFILIWLLPELFSASFESFGELLLFKLDSAGKLASFCVWLFNDWKLCELFKSFKRFETILGGIASVFGLSNDF